MPRALVAGTVLVCLGVGGYAGQVWWARRLADEIARSADLDRHHPWMEEGLPDIAGPRFAPDKARLILAEWRNCPWHGWWFCLEHFWIPRRYSYERLKVLAGQDLGNDPDAWEAWFKAHPDLVWDGKRKRLVDRPSPP